MGRSFSVHVFALSFVFIILWLSWVSSPGYADEPEKVNIRAEKRVQYDTQSKVLVMEGNVRITQGETQIRADRVEVDMEKKVARVTGNVELTQKDLKLTGETIVAYLTEKRVVAEGSVALAKDEEQEGGRSKERVTVTCDRMELWTEKKEFSAWGKVTVTRKDTRAWADIGIYRDKSKLLTLKGHVRVEHGKEEKLVSDEVIMATDREVIEAKGQVEIDFRI